MEKTRNRPFIYAVGEVIRFHLLYWRQIVKLAKTDVVKTYQGSALGWAWAIIRPAATIAIYYFVFAIGLRSGKPVNGYPYMFYLWSGIIPWFYISGGMVSGAMSIRNHKTLVTKTRFPICTIPTITSVAKFMTHAALIGIVLMLFAISGHGPTIYWLQLPLILLLHFLFVTAWSLFAGVVACFSMDFVQIITTMMRALMWLSGIFFNLNGIKNVVLRKILKANPTALLIEGYRAALINDRWFWDKPTHLIALVAECLILAILGIAIYNRQRRDIPDVI